MLLFRDWAYCLTAMAGVGIVVAANIDPAFALALPPRGGPGPLIGMGLPLVGLVVATVAIARRLRRKE